MKLPVSNDAFGFSGRTLYYIIALTIILLLACTENVFISGWNAIPRTYFFFAASILFFTEYFLQEVVVINLKLNLIDLLVTAAFFLCVSAASLTLLHSTFYIRDGILTALSILFLYFPLRHLQQQSPFVLPLVIVLIVFIELAVGCWQLSYLVGGRGASVQRVNGTFLNTGIFAMFLSCCSPVLLYIAGQAANTPRLLRLACYTALFLTAVFAIILKSRTAVLVLIFLAGLTGRERLQLSAVKKWLIVAGFVAVLVVMFVVKYDSAAGRLFIWQNAWQLFVSKPFLGWGIGGFEKNYLLEQARYFRESAAIHEPYRQLAGNVSTAFNEYIELLVNFGLAGFTLLAVVLAGIFHLLKRSFSFAGSMLIAILLTALFYYTFHITIFLILLLFSLTVISAEAPVIIQFKTFPAVLKKVFPVLILGSCLGLFFYTAQQYIACNTWLKAVNTASADKEKGLQLYRQTYPSLKHRSAFLYNYGAQLYELGEYDSSIRIFKQAGELMTNTDLSMYLGKAYQAAGQFEPAEKSFLDAVYMVPSKFNPPYFLVLLYLGNNRKEKAVTVAGKILDIPVKVPSAEIDSIRARMLRLTTK
ncbi:hypothetical protein ECE50_014670 [Chitinophaga sp. Mgbs1]|uniref:O-antigen ligase-related domain-containing protein n=1 Tax=Chitinophaga solisilvae TaxID=1233460 RepID=A0A433WJU7_9BACT|nr:hypothetical protein [Chitinophaga solisilvae]